MNVAKGLDAGAREAAQLAAGGTAITAVQQYNDSHPDLAAVLSASAPTKLMIGAAKGSFRSTGGGDVGGRRRATQISSGGGDAEEDEEDEEEGAPQLQQQGSSRLSANQQADNNRAQLFGSAVPGPPKALTMRTAEEVRRQYGRDGGAAGGSEDRAATATARWVMNVGAGRERGGSGSASREERSG